MFHEGHNHCNLSRKNKWMYHQYLHIYHFSKLHSYQGTGIGCDAHPKLIGAARSIRYISAWVVSRGCGAGGYLRLDQHYLFPPTISLSRTFFGSPVNSPLINSCRDVTSLAFFSGKNKYQLINTPTNPKDDQFRSI